MDAIWYGFKLAIGLVLGFATIFVLVRWLRFRWYLTVWANATQMPMDVRKAILHRAVKKYRRKRPTMSPEERQRATEVLLAAFGTDVPLDDETRTELLNAAVMMSGK